MKRVIFSGIFFFVCIFFANSSFAGTIFQDIPDLDLRNAVQKREISIAIHPLSKGLAGVVPEEDVEMAKNNGWLVHKGIFYYLKDKDGKNVVYFEVKDDNNIIIVAELYVDTDGDSKFDGVYSVKKLSKTPSVEDFFPPENQDNEYK